MAENLDWHYHEPFGYLDSGAPPGSSDYSTLVILHGVVWHSPVLRKLLPLAHTSNMRIILVNRRDYPNSKPLSPEETELLSRPDISLGAESNQAAIEGFKIFMKDRAMEVLEFTSWLIDENLVKPKGARGESMFGGIGIIGWSGASSIVISILANLAHFSSEMMANLEPYVRNLVLYDCSSNILLGYPNHPTHYFPLEDTSLSVEQRVGVSARWLTGYYEHPALSVLDDQNMKSKIELDELEFEFCEPTSFPLPTLQAMSGEDLAINLAPGVVGVGKAELFSARAQLVGFSQIHRREAFFNSEAAPSICQDEIGTVTESPPNDTNQKNVWPSLRTYFIWCDMSFAHAPLGALSLQSELNLAQEKGEWVRDVTFVRFKGANHFAHWDDPKRTLDTFLSCLSDSPS